MPKFVPSTGPSMGQLHIIPEHSIVAALCKACRTTRELDREAIERNVGSMAYFWEVERRLKCTECGAKQAMLLTGYYVPD